MKTIACTCACLVAASLMSFSLRADEDLEETESVETEEEAAVEEDAEQAALSSKKEKHFHIIPYCRTLDGKAEVLRPGANAWEPIQEGKYYALGTAYRTVGAQTHLVIKFGKEVDVEIKGEASFGTRAQALGEQARVVTLASGTITVKLPRNFPDGLFVISAPGFQAINLKGNSRYTYSKSADGDGDAATIRCLTGDLTIEGRHFTVLSMKAANEIKIRTSLDQLYTGLYGSRGDYIVRLDQGRFLIKDYATGESRQEEKKLDWKLSPQTAVRIHRAMPALGEKMAVTIMTFDATGEMRNRCAFTENTVEVNSGELGPTSKKDREDIAKKAAEATETVAVEADAEEKPADDTPEEEKASSDSSDSSADDFDF